MAGYALGLLLFLSGFIVPPSDGLGIVVDSSVFHESFLAGGIGMLLPFTLLPVVHCLFTLICSMIPGYAFLPTTLMLETSYDTHG